jgi:hypothetical protein
MAFDIIGVCGTSLSSFTVLVNRAQEENDEEDDWWGALLHFTGKDWDWLREFPNGYLTCIDQWEGTYTVAGSRQGVVYERLGDNWSSVDLKNGLFSVKATAKSSVIAVGEGGCVFEIQKGQVLRRKVPTCKLLFGIGVKHDITYVVGSGGVILRIRDNTVVVEQSNTKGSLTSVACDPVGDWANGHQSKRLQIGNLLACALGRGVKPIA